MVLDDLNVRKLEADIQRTNLELCCRLSDHLEEGAIGWKFLLKYLERVFSEAAVVVNSQPN